MRRITKIGSVAVALLIAVPALLSFDLFDGAAASGPPLVYAEETLDPVTHLAYPETAPRGGVYTYGYVVSEAGGDAFTIRERASGGAPLYTWAGEGHISGVATDSDGTDYVFGTDSGRFVYVTSRSSLFDTEIVFEAGSPVTDVALDPTGHWASVVTYHGDVYLFQRQRLLDEGGFVWHHKAPLPAGIAPYNPDAAPDSVRGLEEETFGDLTLRPYAHVVFAGSANSANPSGLFVVAATASAEIWVFDASQGIGPAGANGLRPESHHLGGGKCEKLPVDEMDLEAPCSREATARLVNQIDSLTGGAANPVLAQIRSALRGLFVLDPVFGVVPFGAPNPLLGIEATRGTGTGGHQLVVAAEPTGTLHGLQVHRGSNVPSANGATSIAPLWRLEDSSTPLTTFDLSGYVGLTASGIVRLVTGDLDGRVRSYNASVLSQAAPVHDFTLDTGEGAINRVSVSKGGIGDQKAGAWLSYATDLSKVRLLDVTKRTTDGTPIEMWGGTNPIFGDVTQLRVTNAGSVLVASNGLSLYGAVPAVAIDAAATARKGDEWKAQAIVVSPDTVIVAHEWSLRNKNGTLVASSEEPEITHTFTAEGTYVIQLEVTDSNGFTAAAKRNIVVGGQGPNLELAGPERTTKGAVVLYDFNGTRDPDATEGLGIDRIHFYPYGNDTRMEVPLDNLTVEVLYPEIGEFRATATAFDLDGREAQKTHRITVADGGWCIPEDQVEGANDGCNDPDPPIDDTDPDDDTGDGNDTGNGTTGDNQPPQASFTTSIDGFVLTVDGRSSSDPDGDPLSYTWHFGDGTRGDRAKMQHAYSVGGNYDVHLAVEDGKGGRSVTKQTVNVAACGPDVPPTEDGQVSYKRLGIASASGHTVTYGAAGADAGRFDVRGPTARLLHREPAGGPAVVSAAFTSDGCALYLGRADGTALYMNIEDPSDRTTLRLFGDEDPVQHTAVSADGRHLLFGTRDGQVRLVSERLETVREELSLSAGLTAVHADDHLFNVVLQTDDGRVHLIDGQGRKTGHREVYDHPGTATAMEISPNVDGMGRGWLFIGLSDGRIITLKLQTHRFYLLGSAPLQSGVEVAQLVSGPLDKNGDYLLGAVSASTSTSCRTGTEDPCGRLAIIDGNGPYEDDVPIPKRTTETHRPTKGFAMNPEARHFLLLSEDRTTVHRYDHLWDDGPLLTMSGFASPLVAIGMAENSNAYGLMADGRLVWFYAPPLSDFRVGTHNDTGVPQFHERVSAKRDTTFDPGPTRSGVGTVISYQWDFGDGTTSEDPRPVHKYAVQGRYEVQLTVTSKVTAGRETILTDRYGITLAVWDPPPIAKLAASPYDTSTGAVSITSGETVRFDASESYDPHGGRVVHYRFQFGDGQAVFGTKDRRDHPYSRPGVYYATVTVTDDQGFSATSEKIRVLVANRAPSAAFDWTQPERNETGGWVTYGVPVRFDATASSDPDGRVQEYLWTFPNGATKSGSVVWHTFSSMGSVQVALKVRDGSGDWSTELTRTVTVDDGIRLKHTQDPADGRTIDPTQKVRAHGFVHDLYGYPDAGNGIPNAKVRVEVYYDGTFGSAPATHPYETQTHLTDAQGKMTHTVAYNQDIAFKPGKYRIQLTAILEGSANGDTEYSQTTETHFVVT